MLGSRLYISLAPTPVTIIPVPSSTTAGMESPSHRVLVTLVCVVLGAPDIVTKVSIAVIISVPCVVPGHVDEVRGGVAVAAHVAHVDGVGEHLVVQGGLPESPGIVTISPV